MASVSDILTTVKLIFLLLVQNTTVKQLIILFGEIGEFKKFAKISRLQINTSQSLDIPVLEIAKLILSQIAIFENRRR